MPEEKQLIPERLYVLSLISSHQRLVSAGCGHAVLLVCLHVQAGRTLTQQYSGLSPESSC